MLVSLIIPVHNRIDLFESTIESVIKQTYPNLEIIVVNDGSNIQETERLGQLLDKKRNQFPELNLHVFFTPGLGAPAARNLGFRMSKGQFIQFLDSDDLLLPQKIEKQIVILEKDRSLDLVYSKAQFVDVNLNRKNEFWGRSLSGNYLDYFNFSWQTMCALYRRTAIEKYGLWDEALSINQDWEFSIRYIVLGAKILFIDEVQSLFVQHKEGNIGDSKMTLDKISGKYLSTYKIYTLLIEKSLMSKDLKRLFIKRWIYIILVTSVLRGKVELQHQFSFYKKELSFPLYCLILPLKMRAIARFFLFMYNKLVLNR